ncbi:putative repeat protein (TIGR03943 family) [Allocatelliglobosispora scoriae]|uniref:Putative repeat protein (TIGR03943 family) n=1 Tax=Allocatelliglobosispora scoriae TaxID=643052 RepID=A0A841BS57_9ACTN|nr:TIGR03943 family protein [Allocatelliglobosispora scoriae]MBB5869743.1 putative repeat protein (TIGR03943 family) [Allocatelliglobosispora scoriae]
MNRQAQAVVMVLLGGAILKVTLIGDVYLRYVKEGLRPFLILAGIVLLAAAVMTLYYEFRHGTVVDTECADHDDEHDHAKHAEPKAGWMIIGPVLGLLLVAPPAMGAYAAGQAGTALSAVAESDFAPLPAGDPAEISVLDYASRAIFDNGVSMRGRQVKLTGFLTTGADGRQILARMILSCCAADARPIKVAFAGDGPTGLADDSWVEIVGSYSDKVSVDDVNGEKIPFIDVAEWRQVDAPKQQYE